MAIKKANTAEKKESKKEKVTYNVEVTRAHDVSDDKKTRILFDAKVNGVAVSGMSYMEGVKDGKEWSMVRFHQTKAKNGKYYNVAWFPASKELVEDIAKQIESML